MARYIAGLVASLANEQVLATVEDAHALRSGARLVGHAVLTCTAVSATGETLRSLDNRITQVLRRSADGWKVLHKHTSVPVDHASLKTRLAAQPEADGLAPGGYSRRGHG